ncbi:hypothetical protein COLO4_35349 [Corchorus olitorius]|uniref:DOG1 domain-containing protein n=1 Tax=Corchorus olitorius TaxID=93759 RepID=A0A1R3GHI7_9ROSI|nr:hypothetical protein COLO4_35349 [Corchorus olitorius]
MSGPSESNVSENFQTFFNGWLLRQENFLRQLVHSTNENETQWQGNLIQQVLSHYQQYLEEKTRAVKEEVFLFFSPPWLTTFEKTLLWIGGFKPFLLFNILANSVTELTPEQQESVERVKNETRREERELAEAMATIQESVAMPPLWDLARRSGKLIDGETSELESAMEKLKAAMVRTVEKADNLRSSTAKKVIEILSPTQTVKFLAASAEFQLSVRKWGSIKDQGR